MDGTLAPRLAKVGDRGAVAVDHEEARVLESSADVVRIDPTELPVVAELEDQVKSLTVSELAVEGIVKADVGGETVTCNSAWNGNVFRLDLSLALERGDDRGDLVVDVVRLPGASTPK